MIEARNISKTFSGDRLVLDNVSAKFEKGRNNLIIGQSGSGKTVLMKCLVGLLEVDQGMVLYDERNFSEMLLNERKKIRQEIGMLFQGAALFDSFTVEENVMFPLNMFTEKTPEEKTDRVNFCLKRVNILNSNHLYPSEISGGMKKRVGLARAICLRPSIILYDEPTTGVDPITGDAINDLIVELHDKLKVTSIAVTHDMTSAYKIADSIAMLYKGKIVQVDSPEEIKNTTNPVVKQFITGAATGPITQQENLSFGHIA